MKVCLAILREYMDLESLSGDVKSLSALAEKLSEMGHEVFLTGARISPRLLRNYSVDSRKEEKKYKTFYYSDFPWRPLTSIFCIADFIKCLRKFSGEFDIIQCNLTTPSVSFIGDLINLGNKTPVIIGFGAPLVENTGRVVPYLRKSFLRYLARISISNKFIPRLSLHSCHSYIVSSDFQKRQLRTSGIENKKIRVIPNGIDSEKIKRYNREESRKAFGFADGPVIGYFGHLTHNKGVDTLVLAFRLLLKEMQNARLAIAWSGGGTELEAIKGLIKKTGVNHRVDILGSVDISRFLSALDVVVLPYLFEFGTHWFPNALIETIAMGVPLVSTKLTGIEEIVKDKETGILVRPGSPRETAEAIIKLLNNRKMCQEMIERQREFARKIFDVNTTSRMYIKLYEEILNE